MTLVTGTPIAASELVPGPDYPRQHPVGLCCGLGWYVCATAAWLTSLSPTPTPSIDTCRTSEMIRTVSLG